VQIAAKKQKSHSNPMAKGLYTVGTVIKSIKEKDISAFFFEKHELSRKKYSKRSRMS